MASAAALLTGNRRRVSSAVSTQLGRVTKAVTDPSLRRPNTGPGSGRAGLPQIAPQVPLRTRNGNGSTTNGNQPVIDSAGGLGLPGGISIDLGGLFTGGTGGVPSGPTGGLCDLLPDYLKGICLQLASGGGGSGAGGSTATGTGVCPTGTIRVGDTCVSPGDLFPGGSPGTFPAGQTAVSGAFGLPAFTPVQEQKLVRRCGPGMVLGRDNLCYPKQILPPRSMWRKWKRAQRPPISAGDMKAIRKAAAAQGRVKNLAKDVGFSCKKR